MGPLIQNEIQRKSSYQWQHQNTYHYMKCRLWFVRTSQVDCSCWGLPAVKQQKSVVVLLTTKSEIDSRLPMVVEQSWGMLPVYCEWVWDSYVECKAENAPGWHFTCTDLEDA